MSKRIQSFFRFQYLALLLFAPAYGNTLNWTVTLTPSPNLSGAPGSTVVWDYSITDLSTTYWLVLDSLNAGSFLFGTPNDIFDYPIVAPGDTVTGSLYEETFNPTATPGSVDSGVFNFTAEFDTGDPTGNGLFHAIAPEKFIDYTATVETAATPEPSTLVLLVAALTILLWRFRKRSVIG